MLIDGLISFPLFIMFEKIADMPATGLLLFIIYFLLFYISPIQGTFGDYLMKLKVVSFDGKKMDVWQSLKRIIGILITFFTFGIINRHNWTKEIWFHDSYSKSKLILQSEK